MAYIGKQPTVGNFVKLDAITTSATTTFNLLSGGVAYYPQSANHCIVSLNGVIQSPNTSFTISGSTIVFASALTSSDVIDFILVLGDVLNIGTPSDATVGFSKITSNLITGATAETSIAGGDQILIYDDSATALRKMTRTNFVAGVGGNNTPAFHAYKTTDQSVTSGTLTKVVLSSELFDTDNCFDSTTNYRFTPTTSGKYFIYGHIYPDGSSYPSSWSVRIYKNGSSIAGSYFNSSETSQYGTISIASIIELNGSTDYVELYGQCTQSGSPFFTGGQTNLYFGGYKLIT